MLAHSLTLITTSACKFDGFLRSTGSSSSNYNWKTSWGDWGQNQPKRSDWGQTYDPWGQAGAAASTSPDDHQVGAHKKI